jgi:hypothetical protein
MTAARTTPSHRGFAATRVTLITAANSNRRAGSSLFARRTPDLRRRLAAAFPCHTLALLTITLRREVLAPDPPRGMVTLMCRALHAMMYSGLG